MKRGVVAPTFLQEPEPGQAIEMALDVVHPFTKEAALADVLLSNIKAICHDPHAVNKSRADLLAQFSARATALMQMSLNELMSVRDPHLCRLLRESRTIRSLP